MSQPYLEVKGANEKLKLLGETFQLSEGPRFLANIYPLSLYFGFTFTIGPFGPIKLIVNLAGDPRIIYVPFHFCWSVFCGYRIHSCFRFRGYECLTQCEILKQHLILNQKLEPMPRGRGRRYSLQTLYL